jgi:competence transcription factor ComK
MIGVDMKIPILIEESRNIIFFPLKSVRDKCNIWISYNNLEKYIKSGDKPIFIFNNKKEVIIDFSYYIIDNQVTRSLMLDYEVKKRRESLKK